MPVNKRQLDQAFEDLGKTFGGLREDYFALLYLTEYWERSIEQTARQIAFGGDDYGIDAFHIDRDGRALYLYQFKWTENHQQFRGSLERVVRDGIERIFGNPTQDSRKNPFLVELHSRLDEARPLIERVYIYFVFNGDVEAAERSAVLDSLREDLESKKHFLDEYFGRNVTLSFQVISNKGGRSAPSPVRKTFRYEVPFQNSLIAANATGETMHVGFLRLMDLYRMHLEMGPRLLNRNIRFGLSPDNSPNRSLRQSLRRIVLDDADPAEVFTFNHNGVTLSAERLEFTDDRCTITEPRVLNGAQTVTTFARFMEDNREHPAMTTGRSRLEGIRVLAKVVTAASDDFVVGVTVCNNRQNPVEPWHLRASHRTQLELEDKFRDELGLFYERQEGAWESLSDDELEEMGIEQSAKAIQIRRLAQTFLAIQGEVDRMSRLREVFESEKIYLDTFRDSFLRGDAQKIVLIYKIQLQLRSILRHIVENHATKYEYFRQAKNLVWALLAQAVLNHSQLDRWREDYGRTLVMQTDYVNELKALGTGKVWSVMKETVGTPEIESQIAAGRYAFLRSKTTYKKCMEVAYEKHGWIKKGI